MHFVQCFLFAILLIVTFDGTLCESPKKLRFRPAPHSYSMHMREFHECVSCNADDNARKDFQTCLKNLSETNKKLARTCCTKTYSEPFCTKAYNGEIDFPRVCGNPMKGLEVERCFWKRTDKATADIEAFRQCKRKILNRFCTTRSES